MNIALFYHSLYSDWNHGNAHFLRGVAHELKQKGHNVLIFEPSKGWSMQNLLKNYGNKPIEDFKEYFPNLSSRLYDLPDTDLREELKDIDLVIVHEWNEPELVSFLGKLKTISGFTLLFHDTHHRAVTKPEEISRFDLSGYDGVLAFGDIIKKIYLKNGWAKRAWTWHEAADTHLFKPSETANRNGDVVWIGNWGDEERTRELYEFLIDPVRELNLKAAVYGVRYPLKAIEALTRAGIEYRGWLPNYRVPEVFSAFKASIHIPRRPYVEKLPGIPTIRPFEALACGIPLICSPWDDSEGLFTLGKDYLMANNKDQMKEKLTQVLNDQQLWKQLSEHGLRTIRERHTCRHRVEQLVDIYQAVKSDSENRKIKNKP